LSTDWDQHYTLCNYARVCTTFFSLFRMNQAKNCDPYKLIPNYFYRFNGKVFLIFFCITPHARKIKKSTVEFHTSKNINKSTAHGCWTLDFFISDIKLQAILRIDLNLFSVHEETNPRMWCTLCNYARVCTTFFYLFRMNRAKNCDPYKLIPN
jgi:hypothetical protein